MRRKLGWVLLAATLAAAGASVFSLLQDEEYSAAATISSERPVSSNRPPGRQAAKDLDRGSRDIIARRTERRLGRGDAAVTDAVSTVAVRGDGEDRIEVEATAGSPRTAARVANAFADEYVAFAGDVASRIRSLKGRSRDLKTMASLQAGNAVVVNRATPPGSPSSPKPVRDTLIGALAGLLLGFGVVVVREKFDRRLRDPQDLEDVFDLPVLASLPDSEALGKRFGMAHRLPPLEAEAFRRLSASLCHFEHERTVDSVLVTSAAARDGKSTVAFNLAAAAAAEGLDVLLVEAEVRRPILARSLGLPPDEGLTSVLAGETRLRDACHEVLLIHGNGGGSPPTMDVLLAGETRPDAGELVESAGMRDVIQECRRNYSLVVIDSPAAELASDGISRMSDVGAVVVVGHIGKLTDGQAARLRDRLEKIDAPTLGVVANFAGS